MAWHEIPLEYVASNFQEQLASMQDLGRGAGPGGITPDAHKHVIDVKLAWTDNERRIAVFVTEMLAAGTLHECVGGSLHSRFCLLSSCMPPSPQLHDSCRRTYPVNVVEEVVPANPGGPGVHAWPCTPGDPP